MRGGGGGGILQSAQLFGCRAISVTTLVAFFLISRFYLFFVFVGKYAFVPYFFLRLLNFLHIKIYVSYTVYIYIFFTCFSFTHNE